MLFSDHHPYLKLRHQKHVLIQSDAADRLGSKASGISGRTQIRVLPATQVISTDTFPYLAQPFQLKPRSTCTSFTNTHVLFISQFTLRPTIGLYSEHDKLCTCPRILFKIMFITELPSISRSFKVLISFSFFLSKSFVISLHRCHMLYPSNSLRIDTPDYAIW